jgi:small subunit ribosomal protein S1
MAGDISDMSWRSTTSQRDGEEGDAEGENLSIDKENRRFLGIKQLVEDPCPRSPPSVGSDRDACPPRLLDRGLVVEIDPGVEAFVPIQFLGVPDLKKPEEAFKEGDSIPVRLIEVDKTARKVVASVTDYMKAREAAEMSQYLASHPVTTVKLADAADPKKKRRKKGDETDAEGTDAAAVTGEPESDI